MVLSISGGGGTIPKILLLICINYYFVYTLNIAAVLSNNIIRVNFYLFEDWKCGESLNYKNFIINLYKLLFCIYFKHLLLIIKLIINRCFQDLKYEQGQFVEKEQRILSGRLRKYCLLTQQRIGG